MAGAAVGEERDVKVTFPTEYVPELAGKDAVFHIKVHQITRRAMPEWDDDFARRQGFADVSALRRAVMETAVQKKQAQAAEQFANDLIRQVTEAMTVTIPAAMVENQLDGLINELRGHLQAQGVSLEQYLEMGNTTMEQLPAYMEHVKYYSDLAIPLFNIHIFVNYNGYFILPILAAGGQFLMTKLTGTAQTPAADDAQAQQAQNSMKFMNYFFPIFTLILCFNYNAIFALYWVASNVIAIVQTKGINMYLDRKEALEAANPNKNTGSLK